MVKLYKFKSAEVAGVPHGAEKRLDSESKNTKTWLKLGHIVEVKKSKK